jgi:hypothetical protein
MKVQPYHFKRLEEGLQQVDLAPKALVYFKQEKTFTSFCWNMFWEFIDSGTDLAFEWNGTMMLYNDAHIETALKTAIKNRGIEAW